MEQEGIPVSNRWEDGMNDRIRELDQMIWERNQSLRKAPAGYLAVTKWQNHVYYRWKIPEGDKTLHPEKDRQLIRALAQKSYDRKVLRCAQEERAQLTRFLRRFPELRPEEVAGTLTPERLALVDPIRMTDADYIAHWLAQPTQPFRTEGLIYPTDRGERVRSRAEALIANRLYQMGIPYRYEPELYLEGYGKTRPDFVLLRRQNRTEFYFEYFGLLDDPEYLERALQKLRADQNNGYWPGETLLFAGETRNHPLDLSEVVARIEHFCNREADSGDRIR